MKTNTKLKKKVLTHEGGRAESHMKAEVELERAVATCLLWENTFYEEGNDIAERIASLCKVVDPVKVAALAVKARNEYKLRHVPLFLCRQLAMIAGGRKDGLVRNTLESVIQRPDEMGEFLSIYWKEKKQPLSGQVKKGLRAAFSKFTAYQLSKWDREANVKLRDVMFLVHPKPEDEELFKKIASRSTESADTWEVALSAGKDKKESWERLLKENKLGYMALLMNLRNMESVKVDRGLIEEALIKGAPKSRALPFRFVAAANHAPKYEEVLGRAIMASMASMEKLPGKTVFIIDVSGSMRSQLSSRSEMDRIDAACALAMLIREVCDDVSIYATAGNDGTRIHATEIVPSRRTFALRDAIRAREMKLGGGGIFLTQCIEYVAKFEKQADRVIVLTDEQDCDMKLSPEKAQLIGKNNYILNVAQYNRAISFGRWTTINGWSERVVDWIRLTETQVQGG